MALIGNDGRVERAEQTEQDLTCDTARWYLAAAGVGTLRFIGRATPESAGEGGAAAVPGVGPVATPKIEHRAWPTTPSAWTEALAGCDVVMRSGFDDAADAVLDVSAQLGIPLVVVRNRDDVVDLVRFAGQRVGPSPVAHRAAIREPLPPPPTPEQGAGAPTAGAVVAGTLAACEVLLLLAQVAGRPAPGARHVRVPLCAGEIATQNIPWPPPPPA